MKKLLLLLALICLLSACAPSSPVETLPVSSTASASLPETTAATNPSLTVCPLPTPLDLNNLTDCTLHISFEEEDVYLDDTGILRLDATVYEYDRYDLVEVSMLKPGDTIVLREAEILIHSIEYADNGILINGGLDSGGYYLASDENGVFFETGYSDVKSFYPLGNVTLRISGDFEYTDRSNLDSDPRIWYPGDFLIDDVGIDYFFTPHNTTITLAAGQIIHMERVYIP